MREFYLDSFTLLFYKIGYMDTYPIVHRNLIFNIIAEYDISFSEIRKLLDHLIDENAFAVEGQYSADGPQMYELYLDDYHYVVDVLNYEVAIYKREKKIDVMGS
jgi:hypothetical protein